MSKTSFTIEPGKQEIMMTHVFDAPRELVFRAFTEPQHIANWWGPRSLTNKIDKLELRPGGLWRFVQRDADGNEFAFHGVFHEITAPARVVQTFEFEGMPGHVLLETLTLEERDGKTLVTTKDVFQSVEDRDGMVSSGMESGSTESMERLEELLATLQAEPAPVK